MLRQLRARLAHEWPLWCVIITYSVVLIWLAYGGGAKLLEDASATPEPCQVHVLRLPPDTIVDIACPPGTVARVDMGLVICDCPAAPTTSGVP